MQPPTARIAQPWSPHPTAAPLTAQEGESYLTEANSTRTCAGGWQFEYTGVEGGQRYSLTVQVEHQGLACVRDALLCTAYWTKLSPDNARSGTAPWDYLLPRDGDDGRIRFMRTVTAPPDSDYLTLRCTFRWAAAGRAVWRPPVVEPVPDEPEAPRSVRLAVVTGHAHSRPRPVPDLQTNVEFYGRLCEQACVEANPDLIALPEIALQWQVPGHALDLAVPVDSPEAQTFADLAHRYRTRLVLGMHERDGDAVFNSAILFGPDGTVEGRYRKVHLAVGGEAESGILPGDSFPVVDTSIGRIGFNICMDSSAAESSRMVGLNGADFLVLPIMGDHRADRWTPGSPIFHESRWLAVMRTRAMDNQLTMVIARNTVQGSCVIDRKGDLLAWNEGDKDYIIADVPRDPGYRTWNGACFVDVNWMQRRPHVYGAFCETRCVGSLEGTSER